MSLPTIAIFTLIAAFCNGAVVALIVNMLSETNRAEAAVTARQQTADVLLGYVFDTVLEPPPRCTAPVRPEAPELCWGDTGISCELQAAALLHQLGKARHQRVIGDRLVA